VKQNQPVTADAEQPVITEPEVKSLGEGRWDAKNGKRFFILIAAALFLGYGAVKLAQTHPGSPIGLIAGVVMVAGFFIAYRKFIYSPKKKAGEAFLAARPITIFAKKK